MHVLFNSIYVAFTTLRFFFHVIRMPLLSISLFPCFVFLVVFSGLIYVSILFSTIAEEINR